MCFQPKLQPKPHPTHIAIPSHAPNPTIMLGPTSPGQNGAYKASHHKWQINMNGVLPCMPWAMGHGTMQSLLRLSSKESFCPHKYGIASSCTPCRNATKSPPPSTGCVYMQCCVSDIILPRSRCGWAAPPVCHCVGQSGRWHRNLLRSS